MMRKRGSDAQKVRQQGCAPIVLDCTRLPSEFRSGFPGEQLVNRGAPLKDARFGFGTAAQRAFQRRPNRRLAVGRNVIEHRCEWIV